MGYKLWTPGNFDSRIDAFYRLPSGVAHEFVTFLRMKAMID